LLTLLLGWWLCLSYILCFVNTKIRNLNLPAKSFF